MALTEITVKKLKPKEKRYMVADERGLYIEVYTNGTKSWRFRKIYDGKQTKISLGMYPEITLAEARNICEEMRRKAAHGEQLKEVSEPTFAEIANEWLDNRIRPDKAKTYIENIEQRFKNHILPIIGNMKLREINSFKVLELCRGIEAKGLFETPIRCKKIIGQVFKYAIATGRAEIEPTYALSGALKTRKEKHYAALTDHTKIAYLINQINFYPFLIVRFALMFSALTFCRPGEIRHAEWSEINFEKKEWRLPEEKMKMKQVHIVPLSKQAIKILKDLQPLTGRQKWLFPSTRKDGRPMSENTVSMALRAMGFSREEMTAHGFRGMASTIFNENFFSPDVIERQLAHVPPNSSRSAYNHAEYLPERQRMMQWYADYLDSLGQKKIDL